MSSTSYQFIVIGGGIAGASVAAELAQDASVLLLERESQPGYHSTGRSAAMFIPSYGPRSIQALTRASGEFFNDPPKPFGETGLLTPRSELLIAKTDQLVALEKFIRETSDSSDIKALSAAEVKTLCPLVKPGYAAAGVLDSSGSDIDVHTLHRGYLSLLKQRGGNLQVNTGVNRIKQVNGHWHLGSSSGDYQAETIINAAGAWADQIGHLAGAESIGLSPRRRTAMTIEVPNRATLDQLPLTADIDEQFYIKPDAGNLLISPANETPTPPCDAQPEELEIAECIDRIETAFEIKVTRIVSKWAGLRSFVEDKSPVIGYSNKADNFFWLAGQGGYGIQSSPALSRLAAALALKKAAPEDILKFGLDIDSVLVDRLQT